MFWSLILNPSPHLDSERSFLCKEQLSPTPTDRVPFLGLAGYLPKMFFRLGEVSVGSLEGSFTTAVCALGQKHQPEQDPYRPFPKHSSESNRNQQTNKCKKNKILCEQTQAVSSLPEEMGD